MPLTNDGDYVSTEAELLARVLETLREIRVILQQMHDRNA
jgi:hypothetical protein